MDTMYCEISGGHWEAWTYSDGDKYYLRSLRTMPDILNYCEKHGYKLVVVK